MSKKTLLIISFFLFYYLSAYSLVCDNKSSTCDAFNNPPRLNVGEIYSITMGSLNPGTPIVLIHGAGHNLKYFKSLAIRLSLAHKVILIDLRGHGRTKAIGTNYSAEVLSLDIYEKLKALKIAKAHFIGHSFGAKVVAQFAAKYPQMTDNVVFIDMEFIARTAFVVSDLEKMLNEGTLLEKKIPSVFNNYDEAMKTLSPFYGEMTPYKLQNDAYLDAQGIHILFNPSVDFYFFGYQMNLEDQTAVIKNIRSPVLLVAGTVGSAISKKGLDHAIANIKNLEVKKIEGAGHAPHMTHLEEFLKVINLFILANE
ncbi:alpha/beta hydrolase [bacterium]|nr:alpha/beta hydrolase [bacterium]